MKAHNRLTSCKVAVIAFLSIFLCVTSSWSATYYVDKNNKGASDSNPGTEANPWKTIQKGASMAVAGDMVYVKSGVYYEWVDVKNSGASGKPIIFIAYPGDKPIIDGTGVSVPYWKALIWSRGNDYITIDGFEVRNTSELLINLNHGKYLTIRNCVGHGNSGPAQKPLNGKSGFFIGHSSYGLVENCEVYDTGGNCFYAESSNYVTFKNNYAHDNPAHAGFNLFPKTTENPQGHYYGSIVKNNIVARCATGILFRYQVNAEISNNLIYGCGASGILLDNNQKDYPSLSHNFKGNTKIYKNTVVDNCLKNTSAHGIANYNATYVAINNNIVANNGNKIIYIGSGAITGSKIDNNLYGTSASFYWGGIKYSSFSSWKAVSNDSGSSTGDWNFMNKSIGDYTLTSTDANIGKGVDMATVGIMSVGKSALNPPDNLRVAQK